MRPESEIPVKILMVNRNPLDQFIIGDAVDIGDVILHCAESAVEATRLIEKSFYSLLMIDPGMQHQSGIELLKFLRDGEKTTHIPVVFFSSEETNTDSLISNQSPSDIDILSECSDFKNTEGHLRTLIDGAKYRKKILLEKNEMRTELNKYSVLIENLSPEYAFKFNVEEKQPKTVSHENATVMITGFANFTSIAEKENPQELNKKIEIYFQKFNEIMERYEVDKIYTLGDAVISAGGMRQGDAQSAVKMIMVALEMQHYVNNLAESDLSSGKNPWFFCCGISTGSLISDSIIHAPFDIWGPAVTEAIGLKKNAGENNIIISESAKTLVEDSFELKSLGFHKVNNQRDQELFKVIKIKKPHPAKWADRISNQLYLP